MPDRDDFVDWAMAPDRTLEERCAVEKVVEWGVMLDHARRGVHDRLSWDRQREIRNARRLNPAYEPKLDPAAVRTGAAALGQRPDYSNHSSDDRPMRDLGWIRFFPQFEQLHLGEMEAVDYSPLASLPRLRTLSIRDDLVLDLRPLAQCAALEELTIYARQPWIKVDGLERLEKLHKLKWHASPHSLQSIRTLPALRHATLGGFGTSDFPLRDALQLPAMPSLEALDVESLFSLDGLERYPRLVNLTVEGPYRDLRPLIACRALTHLWLKLSIHLHLDVLSDLSPLVQLPELRFLEVRSQRPRDYSLLVEAPRLHELSLMDILLTPLQSCAMEQATLNATLEPWDAEFLLPAPRPLPPLVIGYVDPQKQEEFPHPPPMSDPPPWDQNPGFRESEGKWLTKRLGPRLRKLLDNDPHWGGVGFGFHGLSAHRGIGITIKSQDGAERLREIIEFIRAEFASLRCSWRAHLDIHLELPPVNDPKAMARIERANWGDDEEEFERHRKEQAEYLERKHRYELQKEAGAKIRPEDFAAPGTEPAPKDQDADADDDDDSGDTATLEEDEGETLADMFQPDRPHPLNQRYCLGGVIDEGGAWFYAHFRQTAEHLLSGKPPP